MLQNLQNFQFAKLECLKEVLATNNEIFET